MAAKNIPACIWKETRTTKHYGRVDTCLHGNRGEEEYLKNLLEGMRKARETHVQQESDVKIKRALKGRIREHEIGG